MDFSRGEVGPGEARQGRGWDGEGVTRQSSGAEGWAGLLWAHSWHRVPGSWSLGEGKAAPVPRSSSDLHPAALPALARLLRASTTTLAQGSTPGSSLLKIDITMVAMSKLGVAG